MKIFKLLICACAINLAAQAQINTKLSPQQKLAQLFNPNSKQVLVAAHRGDWRNAPENSLLALKYSVAMGADIMELDLKKNKDGHLIVMHDKTVDRSTNGKGKPEDYTLEEIKKMRLKNGLGRVTKHQIPNFEEMLVVAKDKIIIDVDKGYDYFNEVVALVKKHGMLNQTIININDNTFLDSVAQRYGKIDTGIVLMPIINYKNANAKKIIESYYRHKKTVFQPVFETDTFSLINHHASLKKMGYGVWLNSLWPSLNGHHDDDIAVEENQPNQSWGWLLEHGASIIQTDRPKELINYLHQKEWR